MLRFPSVVERACELGEVCAYEVGAWCSDAEVDRLASGPLCSAHRVYVDAFLATMPQWEESATTRVRRGVAEVLVVPTKAAVMLARFRGAAVPEGWWGVPEPGGGWRRP